MNRSAKLACALGAAGLVLSVVATSPVAAGAQAGAPANPAARLGGPHLMRKLPPGPVPAAPMAAHLNYYGGPVVSNATVQGVFWGTGPYTATAGPGGAMPGFYNGVGASPYFDWLTEYNTTSQVIGHANSLAETTITPSAANNGPIINDSNMQAELKAQITAGHLPQPALDSHGNVNTIYALYFPDNGETLKAPDGSVGGVIWCAYHGTMVYSGHDVPYMVLPAFTPTSPYAHGCGANPTLFNNFTSVSSHELVETVTDTAVGLATVVGPPLAWYDPNNGEIGDICNAQQGSIAGYTVQKQWDNATGACIVSKPSAGNLIQNGGFETGALAPWAPVGTAAVVSGGHSGSHSAQTGSTTVGVAASKISQSVALPAGSHTLTVWYKLVCPDSVKTGDWATVTVKYGTTTKTALKKTCTNTGTWQQATYNLPAAASGTTVTVTLASNDKASGGATYSLWDDISLT